VLLADIVKIKIQIHRTASMITLSWSFTLQEHVLMFCGLTFIWIIYRCRTAVPTSHKTLSAL